MLGVGGCRLHGGLIPTRRASAAVEVGRRNAENLAERLRQPNHSAILSKNC